MNASTYFAMLTYGISTGGLKLAFVSWLTSMAVFGFGRAIGRSWGIGIAMMIAYTIGMFVGWTIWICAVLD